MTTLTPEIQARVQSIVASGGYDDENAVLAEAISLLEKRNELRAFLKVGLAQLERGECIDGDEVFRELEADAAEIERRCS